VTINWKETKGIFQEKPVITADNFFGNDVVDCWIGEKWFDFLVTTRRDCLPRGVPDWAWHKESVNVKDLQARVSRFLHPITAVCTDTTQQYSRVFCSFQSAGPTNISAVNTLNVNSLFSRAKSRGTGGNKRSWVIEMNDARQLYLLATYGRIDKIDYCIMQCQIFYAIWKYWHAAKNHALAIAVVTAYDMYDELISEKKAHDFFGISGDDNKMKLNFHQFRYCLSTKGLQYDPGFNQYNKEDERMRVNTKKGANKMKKKAKRNNSVYICDDNSDEDSAALATPVTISNLLTHAQQKRDRPSKEDAFPHGVVTPELLAQALKDKD
jgi:hypothetical protein